MGGGSGGQGVGAVGAAKGTPLSERGGPPKSDLPAGGGGGAPYLQSRCQSRATYHRLHHTPIRLRQGQQKRPTWINRRRRRGRYSEKRAVRSPFSCGFLAGGNGPGAGSRRGSGGPPGCVSLPPPSSGLHLPPESKGLHRLGCRRWRTKGVGPLDRSRSLTGRDPSAGRNTSCVAGKKSSAAP